MSPTIRHLVIEAVRESLYEDILDVADDLEKDTAQNLVLRLRKLATKCGGKVAELLNKAADDIAEQREDATPDIAIEQAALLMKDK